MKPPKGAIPVQERAAGVYKSHRLQPSVDYLQKHPTVDQFNSKTWNNENWAAAISNTLNTLHIDHDQRGEMLTAASLNNIATLVKSFSEGMNDVLATSDLSGHPVGEPLLFISNQGWLDNHKVGEGIPHIYKHDDPEGPSITLSAATLVNLAKNRLDLVSDRVLRGKGDKTDVISSRSSEKGASYLDGIFYTAVHIFREIYPAYAKRNRSQNLREMRTVADFDAQPEKMLALLFETYHVITKLNARRGPKDFDDGSVAVLLKRIDTAWSKFEKSKFEDVDGFSEQRRQITDFYWESIRARSVTPSAEVAKIMSSWSDVSAAA